MSSDLIMISRSSFTSSTRPALFHFRNVLRQHDNSSSFRADRAISRSVARSSLLSILPASGISVSSAMLERCGNRGGLARPGRAPASAADAVTPALEPHGFPSSRGTLLLATSQTMSGATLSYPCRSQLPMPLKSFQGRSPSSAFEGSSIEFRSVASITRSIQRSTASLVLPSCALVGKSRNRRNFTDTRSPAAPSSRGGGVCRGAQVRRPRQRQSSCRA